MTGLNASSRITQNQWRNELTMKTFNHQDYKDPNSAYRNQILGNTVCCSQGDCDKVKVEQIAQEGPNRRRIDSTLYPQFSTTYPASRDATPSGKKDGNHKPCNFAPEPYNPPMGAHWITYCCIRRDCDDSTKVGSVCDRAFSHYKY